MTTANVTRLAGLLKQTCAARLSPESDARLLALYLHDRDPAAFEALVSRHGPLVLAACRKVLTDPADVDDVFQATFLVLLRQPGAVRRRSSLGSWLYGVAHRIALRARDSAARRRRLTRKAARPAEAPAAVSLSWQEACDVLHEELDKLPDKQRLPLLLCYLEGLSRDEAATRLGRTLPAVKADLERGREKLRQRLARRGIAPSAGLLAAVAGNSAATGGPSPELVQLAMRAAGGGASAAVAVLVRGASPMRWLGKKTAAALAVMAGLIAAGAGLSRPETDAGATEEPPTAMQGPAAKPEPAGDAKAEAPLIDTTVGGQVVSTDGKPVAGAKVFWVEGKIPIVPPQQRATTDKDGRFSFTVRHPTWEVHPSLKREVAHFGFPFVSADGFGFGWAWIFGVDPAKLTVIVPPDTQPFTGQVIGLEGRPVAGVRVSLRELSAPPDWKDLSGWLKAVRDPNPDRQLAGLFPMFDYGHVALRGMYPKTVTDQQGRFTIRGIGRDRVAMLRLEGDAVETQDINAINREVERFTVRDPFNGYQLRTYYGLPCKLVAAPGITVAGVIKDKNAGKPIPGATITATLELANGFISEIKTTSGPDGRYRLTGLHRKKREFSPPYLKVSPPDGEPYPQVPIILVPDPKGPNPIPLDISMKRGLFLTVKVIDKQTRKPVPATCSYVPLPGNSYVDRDIGYDFSSSSPEPGRVEVRLVALPGPGVVMATAQGQPYRIGVMPESLTQFVGPPGQFNYALGSFGIRDVNTFTEINIGPTAAQATVTVELDPGLSVPGTIIGPDGHKLSGAMMAGLLPGMPQFDMVPLPTAQFQARAFGPGEKRRVIVLHPEKLLAGSAVVTGGQKEPVVIKLEPCGEVIGRAVDEDGQPVKRVYTGSLTDDESLTDLNRGVYPPLASNTPPEQPTDGRFRLRGLAPGLKYRFMVSMEKNQREQTSVMVEGIVKPGEVKDLGDLRYPVPGP